MDDLRLYGLVFQQCYKLYCCKNTDFSDLNHPMYGETSVSFVFPKGIIIPTLTNGDLIYFNTINYLTCVKICFI